MCTPAQFHSLRSVVLSDMKGVADDYTLGRISRDAYLRKHRDLSLFLCELNSMEIESRRTLQ